MTTKELTRPAETPAQARARAVTLALAGLGFGALVGALAIFIGSPRR